MPYSITRPAEHLLWVVIEGYLALDHAEDYFREMWGLLDERAVPTDLLIDGRLIAGGAPGARRRTEQIVHHPNLGHLAFVVGELHVLMFAPLVKLVSGVGIFGDEQAALAYLQDVRGLSTRANLALPNLPPPPAVRAHAVDAQPLPSAAGERRPSFTQPPPTAPRTADAQPLPSAAGERRPSRTLPPPAAPRTADAQPLASAAGERRPPARKLPPLPSSRLKRTPITQHRPTPSYDGSRAGAGDGEGD